jgi:hypothetical protein
MVWNGGGDRGAPLKRDWPLLLQYSIRFTGGLSYLLLKVRKGVLDDWELHLWHQEPTFPRKSNIFILGYRC